ncbi:hypothetical protein [Paludisphaera borealis]|uniref:Uncharacterized protein n=1 Tax=Paludisphaera borealis TaxID=1387353 RepID=A0A1U7CUG1_9BACT|nr:hypothetical protein [Paludisphaera borealis]APW62529.1 hypothetical protein BSF38_04077 [Paludisphaera borealis]
MQRVKEGKSRSATTGVSGPHRASAAALALGPAGGAFGRIGSPHGAEFRHGPASARAGDGEAGRGFAAFGPQQHDAFLHLLPQLQCSLCSSASKGGAEETCIASTLRPCPRLSASTTAGNNLQANLRVQG